MSAILRPNKIGAGNASDQEEQSKDEIISLALQKLLDRKIDNTIAIAQASLSNEVTAPIKKEEIPVTNVIPIIVTPTANSTPVVASREENEDIARPSLGQEIKISKPAVVMAVPVSSEVSIPIHTQQPIPPVQSAITQPQPLNVQPLSQTVEVKPLTPAVTNQIATPVAVAPVAVVTLSPLPIQQPVQKPAGTIAKFFDSLFGSAPKIPPTV